MHLGELGQRKQVILDHPNSNTSKWSRSTIVQASKNKKETDMFMNFARSLGVVFFFQFGFIKTAEEALLKHGPYMLVVIHLSVSSID